MTTLIWFFSLQSSILFVLLFLNRCLCHVCYNCKPSLIKNSWMDASSFIRRGPEKTFSPMKGSSLTHVLKLSSWWLHKDTGFSIIPPHLENTPNTSIINSFPWLSTRSLKATQFFLLCLSPWGKVYDFTSINVGKLPDLYTTLILVSVSLWAQINFFYNRNDVFMIP